MNTKKLSLFSSVAICVGLIVATSCLSSLGSGIGSLGRAFIVPMFFVMILNMFVGISFGELNRLMPNASGGTSQYLMVGFGSFVSITANLAAYVVTMALTMTAELAMCGIVLRNLFFPSVDARIISMIILLALFFVNWKGLDLFSKVQDIVVILLIGSMFLLGVIGTLKLGTGGVITHQSTPAFSGISGGFQLASVAFWLFIGVEFVIPVAKDMKNPKRDVILSIAIGLALLFSVQSLLGNAMANYVDYAILADDPTGTPHMTFATNMLGGLGKAWMGIITMLAAVSTVNSMFAAPPRIMQGMAEDGNLPTIFYKENKNHVAFAGLTLMAVVTAGFIISNLAVSNGISFVVLAASCLWLIDYILIHGAVLVLRKRYPNAERNKFLILGGIPQIIGIIGNIYMVYAIDVGESRILIYKISVAILAVIIAYAIIWCKFVVKKPLFKPMKLDNIDVEEETEKATREDVVWDTL